MQARTLSPSNKNSSTALNAGNSPLYSMTQDKATLTALAEIFYSFRRLLRGKYARPVRIFLLLPRNNLDTAKQKVGLYKFGATPQNHAART